MGKDSFTFKQFSIQQEACGMKVSQDACLFGAWATFSTSNRLLDIGAGTGLLSLMLAQRYPLARIEAVEIDEAAFRQAKSNIENSPWPERIHLIRGKIQDYKSLIAYDGIICNPPFFPQHLQAQQAGRNLARHTQSLSHRELCIAMHRLLNEGGEACLMLPLQQAKTFLCMAKETGFSLAAWLEVHPTPKKKAHRVFLRLTKTTASSLEKAILQVSDEHGHYTEPFKTLLQPFYLAL